MAGQYLVLSFDGNCRRFECFVAKTNSRDILRYGRTSVVRLAAPGESSTLIPINLGSFSSVKRSQFPWNNCWNGDVRLLVSPARLLSWHTLVFSTRFARFFRNDFEIDPRTDRIFFSSRWTIVFSSTFSCCLRSLRERKIEQSTHNIIKCLKCSTTYDY